MKIVECILIPRLFMRTATNHPPQYLRASRSSNVSGSLKQTARNPLVQSIMTTASTIVSTVQVSKEGGLWQNLRLENKTCRISPRNIGPEPSTKAGFRTYAFASRLLTELKVNCQNLSAIQLGLADWMGVEICMQVFRGARLDRSLAREGSTSATTSNF